MIRLRKLVLGVGGMVLMAVSSFSAGADSKIEVVQSVPIETNLLVPGIRQTQEVWLEMIRSARKTLDIEQFYVSSQPGEAFDPILAAIRAAAERGVQVRVLVDVKFYKNYSREPLGLAEIPNVEVKTIHLDPGVQHAKFFIVDQFNVYLGSANFDWLALSHIHEVGLRISDLAVGRKLGLVFERDWNDGVFIGDGGKLHYSMASGISPLSDPSSDVPVLVASPLSHNPPGVSDSLTAIEQLLDSAKNTIKIQLYQYSRNSNSGSAPWMVLDQVIRRAAARGVHVQLLVDAVTLKLGHSDLKALSECKNIEVRSVVIPPWSGGHLDYARLIHSKYFTVDGVSSWVGTENWIQGYFTQSRNVGIILHSVEVVEQLDKIFGRVWNSGYTS